jgi:hypothetical protein
MNDYSIEQTESLLTEFADENQPKRETEINKCIASEVYDLSSGGLRIATYELEALFKDIEAQKHNGYTYGIQNLSHSTYYLDYRYSADAESRMGTSMPLNIDSNHTDNIQLFNVLDWLNDVYMKNSLILTLTGKKNYEKYSINGILSKEVFSDLLKEGISSKRITFDSSFDETLMNEVPPDLQFFNFIRFLNRNGIQLSNESWDLWVDSMKDKSHLSNIKLINIHKVAFLLAMQQQVTYDMMKNNVSIEYNYNYLPIWMTNKSKKRWRKFFNEDVPVYGDLYKKCHQIWMKYCDKSDPYIQHVIAQPELKNLV